MNESQELKETLAKKHGLFTVIETIIIYNIENEMDKKFVFNPYYDSTKISYSLNDKYVSISYENLDRYHIKLSVYLMSAYKTQTKKAFNEHFKELVLDLITIFHNDDFMHFEVGNTSYYLQFLDNVKYFGNDIKDACITTLDFTKLIEKHDLCIKNIALDGTATYTIS